VGFMIQRAASLYSSRGVDAMEEIQFYYYARLLPPITC